MKEVLRRHTISFQSAVAGLRWAIRTQPNFRVHLALSSLALGASWYFNISHAEWMIIVFTIFFVLTPLIINTSLEAMTDLITQEWRKEAKIAKDVSAGMMLTVAIGALVVSSVIFIPRLIRL